MPLKPAKGGSARAKVDASTSPTRPDDIDIELAGTSRRGGAGAASSADHLASRAGPSSAIDADATRATAAVVVNALPAQASLPASQPTLDHYVINARAMLPELNSEGLRVLNQRTYVDVADGDLVLVAVDPQTGLQRARRPSELLPGPVMLRDADSGLWYAREVVEPTTRAQIERYFPQATDQQVENLIARFGDKDVADVELKRVQSGLAQMERDMAILDGTGSFVAREMASRLRRLYTWQGDPDERVYHDDRLAGFKIEIDLNAWPTHRTFPTTFNSIASLTLRDGSQLNLEVFLRQFPNVDRVLINPPSQYRTFSKLRIENGSVEQSTLRRFRELHLQDCILPDDFSLAGMTRLQLLTLGNIQQGPDLIALVNQLPERSQLQLLDLNQNPYLKAAPTVVGMTQLRVLDLTMTGIHQLPVGLGAENGPSRLEVLRLGYNPLSVVPSLKGMNALQELDLFGTGLDRFPEGITSQLPGKVLNLANNRISAIPESVELRAGLNLSGNPVTDPAQLQRLMDARIKTGSDIWLGGESIDRSVNPWLRHSPLEELPEQLKLWERTGDSTCRQGILKLTRLPDFHLDRPFLQQRVWRFLDVYSKAGARDVFTMRSIMSSELSPGKMLDRLEAEIYSQSEPMPSATDLLRESGSIVQPPRIRDESASRALVRKYFPEATDQHADHFIANFGDKRAAELELQRMQLGIPELDRQVNAAFEQSPHTQMWRKLRRLYKWQGEPDELVFHDARPVGFKTSISLDLWGDDLQLPLQFSSVVSLSLTAGILRKPETFFAHFPSLERLTVISEAWQPRFNADPGFTEQLTKLTRLRELHLQRTSVPSNFSLVGMNELRILDLTQTGLVRLPVGLGADNVAPGLEVLKLGGNPLSEVPTVKGLTALQELDLSNTGLDKFPEGITSQIPGKVLNLANNRITSIPESVELRAGFNLMGNPVTDQASLRRLIRARIETGTDIWLGDLSSDQSSFVWLRNVDKDVAEKQQLWDRVGPSGSLLKNRILLLTRTPEFHAEYPLLQRRVWSFLKIYSELAYGEQLRLNDILLREFSPGKMLDKLEAEIRERDSGRQNQPSHHLPKRPRLDI